MDILTLGKIKKVDDKVDEVVIDVDAKIAQLESDTTTSIDAGASNTDVAISNLTDSVNASINAIDVNTVSGNHTVSGNSNIGGSVNVTSTMTAASFSGDGSALTNLPVTNPFPSSSALTSEATLKIDGPDGSIYWAVESYKSSHVYAYSSTSAGYKSGSPWKNVNLTAHATDTTTNLGDRLDYAGAYLDNGWDDTSEKQYVHGTNYNTGHAGSTSYTSKYNMRTDSGLGGALDMLSNRGSMSVTSDLANRISYLHGGGQGHCTKYNTATESATNLGSGGTGDHTGSIQGEYQGQINFDGTSKQWNFSSEVYLTWSGDQGSHGCMKGLSTKNGWGYIARGGGCSGNNGFDKYNNADGSHISGVHTRPQNGAGEENYSMGQDKGYMLGQYDGLQNNKSFVWYYDSNTGVTLGAAGEPKGHDGMSSGCGASRKA
jgi:hypothetical protein